MHQRLHPWTPLHPCSAALWYTSVLLYHSIVIHCNVLFCYNYSPLVHVMFRVVQPYPDLHGVPLPDPVEDVLHGWSASCPPHYRDLQQTVVSLLTTTAVFFLSDQNNCGSCGAGSYNSLPRTFLSSDIHFLHPTQNQFEHLPPNTNVALIIHWQAMVVFSWNCCPVASPAWCGCCVVAHLSVLSVLPRCVAQPHCSSRTWCAQHNWPALRRTTFLRRLVVAAVSARTARQISPARPPRRPAAAPAPAPGLGCAGVSPSLGRTGHGLRLAQDWQPPSAAESPGGGKQNPEQ